MDHRVHIPMLWRKFRQSSSNAVICVLGTEREGRFSRHGNLVCLVGNGSLSCQIVTFHPSVVSSMRLCLHHIRLTTSLGTLLASSNSARFGNIPASSSSTPRAAFDLFYRALDPLTSPKVLTTATTDLFTHNCRLGSCSSYPLSILWPCLPLELYDL